MEHAHGLERRPEVRLTEPRHADHLDAHPGDPRGAHGHPGEGGAHLAAHAEDQERTLERADGLDGRRGGPAEELLERRDVLDPLGQGSGCIGHRILPPG